MKSAETEIINLSDLIEKFLLEISNEGNGFSTLYTKAVKSLTAFIGDIESVLLTDFDTVIGDWFVNLRVQGFTLKTALAYLSAIGGLYKRVSKSGLVPATEIFKYIRSAICEQGEKLWTSGVQRNDFNRFRTIVSAECLKEESDSIGADILLISLLYGGIPVAETAAWKKEDLPTPAAEAELVVRRVLDKSAKSYIFPLKQSVLTSGQLQKEANRLVLDWLGSRLIRTFGDADTTLLSYWGYSALCAGVPAHEVAASLPRIPESLPFLALCKGVACGSMDKAVVGSSVVKMFAATPKRWYAMHLRTRVTFENLKQRFSEEKELKMPETFYPTQEIARRIGKKLVFEDQPFINNVVFFKSHYDEISPMFNRIGDVAWCYKNTIGTGGTYAPVSQTSFDNFQRAIGCFTPEYMAARPTENVLTVGDTVKILGGIAQGQTGTIKSIENTSPDGILTYLIAVCSEFAGNITACVDSRQVRKVAVTGKA